MTGPDYDRLAEIAAAATPGPWVMAGRCSIEQVHECSPSGGSHKCRGIADTSGMGHPNFNHEWREPERADATHISTFDPPTVADLIARAKAGDELRAGVEGLVGMPAPSKYDDEGHYLGRVGGTEHRTTGGRAWCYQCSEWCASRYACECCEPKIEADDLRALLGNDDDGSRDE